MAKLHLAFKYVRFSVTVLVLSYVTLCAGMAFNQRAFMYVPFPGPIEPAAAGLSHYTRKQITDTKGTPIIYWESDASANAPLLFYFHGNSGGLYKFAPALAYLEKHGYHVIAMEYRGYPGAPTGPSQTHIVSDGQILVETLQQQHPKQKRVFWGYSLGSGIALQVAINHQPDVLILEAPFTALVDRAAEMYPMLPARYLIQDTYLSREAIQKLHMPLFIMHGDADWIVPVHHGHDLFSAANEPKSLTIYPGYGHLNLIHSPAYDDAVSFINSHAN